MEKVLHSYMEHVCGARNVQENVPMRNKTTFRIGGDARFFVTPTTKESFVRLVNALEFIEYRYIVIGFGANLLFPDHGFDGVVIRPLFAEIVDNGCFIYADAGASLAKVCSFAREHNLSGLEWAAGLPSTVGGAVAGNAGAFGDETGNVVAMTDVLHKGKIETLDAKNMKFSYRNSIFKKNRKKIILGAYFQLKPSNRADIVQKEYECLQKRNATQPTEPNAGSIFRKPHPDFFVGKEIEKLGLKGNRIGDAEVSTKHAGFIVNRGKATAGDVKKLIVRIRKKIYKTHKIKLRTEIRIIK